MNNRNLSSLTAVVARVLLTVAVLTSCHTGAIAGTLAAADNIDIQTLNEMKPQWAKLAEQRKSLTIEGRYATRAGSLMKLQKCEITFKASGSVRFRQLDRERNVEVQGYLTEDSGKFIFMVRRIAQGRSDLEQVQRRADALPRDDPEPWHALAAQAARRGTFYEDNALLVESQRIIGEAFNVERSLVKQGDADALRALADRAVDLGLPPERRMGLIHESLRWRWDSLQGGADKNPAELLELIRTELPGANEPTRLREPALRASYLKEPVKTYAAARVSERIKMDRFFLHQILLPHILGRARDDGSNGREIATLLRRQLPEETARADDFEQRELVYRLRNIESAARADMIDLVDRFEALGRQEEAAQARSRWVKAAETRLAARGPAGLIQAAAEYETLLNDRDKAIKLLQQAWEDSSERAEIEQRLERLGVFRRRDRWMTKAEVATLPEDQITQALKSGRVIKGMTPEQVRKTLGSPNRVTRFASSSRIQIVWLFGESVGSKVSVLFERRRGQGTDTATVISVATLRE